jgi:hypothetical protein
MRTNVKGSKINKHGNQLKNRTRETKEMRMRDSSIDDLFVC